MNFLKNIFSEQDGPIMTYQDFWNWFAKNERTFFNVVKNQGNIEEDFFNQLSPKLNELMEGFSYLTGMCDENTVELIFTPDGVVKNIVFVEELVNSAPKLSGWKFASLKPAIDIKDLSIEMEGYKFNDEKLSFYANEVSGYPDEIDITIVHNDLNEDNRAVITNGTYIFLDNYLGELDFVTSIDTISVIGKHEVQDELIPIEKLKSFLIWRQKEFIEKYEGTRYNTEEDNYSIMEAELENGKPLLAVINTDILQWDSKASHPWILSVELFYEGDSNGMPDNQTSEMLDEIENTILNELKDYEGYLHIGRQTAEDVREIYFACKDFRRPSKLLYELQDLYSDRMEINYEIYKDKYWQSFNRFTNNELELED